MIMIYAEPPAITRIFATLQYLLTYKKKTTSYVRKSCM